MKTFDEYIQGRIYEAYVNAGDTYKYHPTFDEVANSYKDTEINMLQRLVGAWGIGKQRAKDYANYIVAWMEKQKEPLYTFAVAYADEPAIEKSHLTDEDAKKLKGLAGDIRVAYCNWQITPLDITAKTMYDVWYNRYLEANADYNNFINSLKGE